MKVLPRPRASLSLRREISLQEAMNEIAQWQLQPLPISGLCYFDNALWIRLEGGEGSVKAARELLGGEEVALLALSRMDDCAPIAAYISQEKARTAALGRRETKGYEEMVNNGRTAFVTAPLLTSLEGGVPVVVDGQIIGAVGVSGLTGAQDAQVAKAAAAVLAK